MDVLVFLFFLVLHTEVLGHFFPEILKTLREFLPISQRLTEDRLGSHTALYHEGCERNTRCILNTLRVKSPGNFSLELLAQGREAVSIDYSLHHRGEEKPCEIVNFSGSDLC